MECALLILASLTWAIFLVLLPALSSYQAAACLTMLLIGINIWASTWSLFKKKRIPVMLNVAQIGMFGLLHFQIFTSCGPQHYHFERCPEAWDWLEFAAAHVLRAVDFLDFLESYGIELQNIKHRGVLSGTVLVAMHLSVGVFLVSVAVLWVGRLWRTIRPASHANLDAAARTRRALLYWQRLQRLQRRVLVVCGAAVIVTAVCQQWQPLDWLSWPGDQILRTLDLGGAMHIFGWKLHGLADGVWLATLGLVLRVLFGSYLARWLRTAHVRLLGSRALKTIDEFAQDLADAEAAVRLRAVVALGELGVAARPAIPTLVAALADSCWPVGAAARLALTRIGPPEPDAFLALLPGLAADDWAVKRKVIELLGQLGPSAGPAIPRLVEMLADRDPHVPALAQAALRRIAPNWLELKVSANAVPALIDKLSANDRGLRRAAADALGGLGGSARTAVTPLLRTLRDRDEYVRLSAMIALDRIKPSWRHEVFALLVVDGRYPDI